MRQNNPQRHKVIYSWKRDSWLLYRGAKSLGYRRRIVLKKASLCVQPAWPHAYMGHGTPIRGVLIGDNMSGTPDLVTTPAQSQGGRRLVFNGLTREWCAVCMNGDLRPVTYASVVWFYIGKLSKMPMLYANNAKHISERVKT